MESPLPADLLELKARLDHWRATRKYNRQRMPEELRQAATEICRRYPRRIVRRVLKLDPWRLQAHAARRTGSTTAPLPLQTAFFQLPTEAVPTQSHLPGSSTAQCRLQIERRDGARLTLSLPLLDLAATRQICADFLRGRQS